MYGIYDLGNGVEATLHTSIETGTEHGKGIPLQYVLVFTRPTQRREIAINSAEAIPVIKEYGKRVTRIVIDPDIDAPIIERIPYGFMTHSGRFFPHVTSTRYPWGGNYSHAQMIVTLPRLP